METKLKFQKLKGNYNQSKWNSTVLQRIFLRNRFRFLKTYKNKIIDAEMFLERKARMPFILTTLD
jgi:hypothetical protein